MIDVVIVSVVLVVYEYRRSKFNFVPTPLQFFCAATMMVFVFPHAIILLDEIGILLPRSLLDRLVSDSRLVRGALAPEPDLANAYIRLFFYSFAAFWLFVVFPSVKNDQRQRPVERLQPMAQNILIGLGIVGLVVYLGAGLGFRPEVMIDRAIHPRAYLLIRQSTGWATLVRHGTFKLAAAAAFFPLVTDRLSLRSLAVVFACVVITVLGGSKASFFWLPIWFFVARSTSGKPLTRSWVKAAGYAGVFILAFGVFGGREQAGNVEEALQRVFDYFLEYRYMSWVVRDCDPSLANAGSFLYSQLITVIPRQVWPDKPLLDFYRTTWQPMYEPVTLYFHTSTYSCLAEAHMMFGKLGAVLYGVVFGLYGWGLYRLVIRARRLPELYLTIALFSDFFLFFRAGFQGPLIYYTLLPYVALRVLWGKSESVERSANRTPSNDDGVPRD